MSDDLNELVKDRAKIDQIEVMRRAGLIGEPERKRNESFLRECFVTGQDDVELLVRVSQILAAWLPSSIGVVLDALVLESNEVRFGVLCAITDVPKASLAQVRGLLVPAMWRSIVTAKDSNVEYIGSKALLCFDPETVRSFILLEDRTSLSTYFLSHLREGGLL